MYPPVIVTRATNLERERNGLIAKLERREVVYAQLVEALEKIAKHVPGSAGHPSALDCCVQMRDDATAALKTAKETE